MIHIKGGLYIDTAPDGGFEIVVRNDSAENAPILRDFVITREEWEAAGRALFGPTPPEGAEVTGAPVEPPDPALLVDKDQETPPKE